MYPLVRAEVPPRSNVKLLTRREFEKANARNWDRLFPCKNFRLLESRTLQFRAEFFNLFNHANLNNPTTNQSSGNFGRILSASQPRAIQLALRYSF